MKISNITPLYNKNSIINSNKGNENNAFCAVTSSREQSLPLNTYYAYTLPSLSFGKIEKIQKPKNFKNLDTFCEYFVNKMQRQLCVVDEDDVKASIKNICETTGVSKKEAINVATRVTQFSSYSQIDKLSEELSKHNEKYNLKCPTNFDIC